MFSTKSIKLAIVAMLTFACVARAQDKPPSPEVMATIKLHTSTLKTSKAPGDRRKAAEALGALGESGKAARRDLCHAMLDTNTAVRAAAADAMRKIDEPLYKLATDIVINSDLQAVVN